MKPTELPYFLFWGCVVLLYAAVSRWAAGRKMVLLAANLFFLSRFALFYPVVCVATATVDYGLALGLGRLNTERRLVRRLLLLLSMVLNLSLILTPRLVPVYLPQGLAWVFPLSLSFFAFQSLSYTIDSYRGACRPHGDYVGHLAGATFFPAMLAGPINRLSQLVGQIRRPEALTREEAADALLMIALGLVKKVLIANYLADNIVNRVFDTPALYSGVEVLAGVFGYALELYFDFSGYSDIAIGAALLLGIRMPANFDRPYWSTSIREFWRRWHISFSSWLRDYLYISMGGSRCGQVRICLNLMVTMLLGGIWHGFNLTFLIWGGLHGLALAMAHLARGKRSRGKETGWFGRVAGWVLTFSFVCFAWIFFRATSVENAQEVLGRMGSLTTGVENLPPELIWGLVAATAAVALPLKLVNGARQLYLRAPMVAQAVVLAALIASLQLLAGGGSSGFVYQNF
jgi:D-alanyl-lipoteichoic acid acyltransferase DltB (MBOAT superfamily)